MISAYEFEGRVKAGEPLTRPEMERLLVSPNLVEVGALAETARKARLGDEVTYGRVCLVAGAPSPVQSSDRPTYVGSSDRPTYVGSSDRPAYGDAGEIRLTGTPASMDEARAWVRGVPGRPAGVPFTAFSLADLVDLVSGDHLALAELAGALRADGLEAVAEVPLDAIGDTENAIEVVRALNHGGLGAWRATVRAAGTLAARLDLIERAAEVQRQTRAFRAFAPLPRLDPAASPGTGFDDVRTVAAARLMSTIPAIQLDWTQYGPKLAQVAITYGGSDIDGINPIDDQSLGARRSPVEDIERQIRAAFAVPVRRNGRYERLS